MSALQREILANAGELVEAVDGEKVIYLRERGGWHGDVRVHRSSRGEHATLHLEGLPPDVVNALMRTLARETELAGVEGDRASYDHEREPGRNAVARSA